MILYDSITLFKFAFLSTLQTLPLVIFSWVLLYIYKIIIISLGGFPFFLKA
jgi:hypothetical protein